MPGSPGAANKKSKLLKQPPDGNPDAAPSAGVAALQAAAQLPNVSSKLARQNSSRDRSSKKSKPSKVRFGCGPVMIFSLIWCDVHLSQYGPGRLAQHNLAWASHGQQQKIRCIVR